MAQSSESQMGLDNSDGSVDLSGWTNWRDSESHQKRSDIFHEIIKNQCLDQLRTIVESGWDVNEELTGYDPQEPLLYAILNSKTYVDVLENVKFLLDHGANPNVAQRLIIMRHGESTSVYRPALHEAAMLGWTNLVKMLLEAGAECQTSDRSENPLALALQTCDCNLDLIELLLEHGADPNDHDDEPENIPLVVAINYSSNRLEERIIIMVQLLLKHGANPNVTYKKDIREYRGVRWVQRTALHEAARKGFTNVVKLLLDAGSKCVTSDVFENPLALALTNHDCPPDLIELLIKHVADLHYVEPMPLLHRLAQYTFHGDHMFLQQQFNLVFLHGGNINMEDDEYGTALECAVRHNGHSNNVRWLIRHGADTSLKFTLLRGNLLQCDKSRFPETPLILLQAGMRVSRAAQTLLSKMEVAISAWLQDDTVNDIWRTIYSMWNQLEEEEFQRVQCKHKKSSFPEYWTQQMVDLQEFSDESLQFYPEDTHISSTGDTRQGYPAMLDKIQRVLHFMSQTQSLQWHCRRCIRENLVSLQPSVVTTLHIPAILKRYILCHQI